MTTPSPSSPAVDTMADDLMKASGLDVSLPAEMQEAYRQSLKDQITQRLGVVLMQTMDEETLESYLEMLGDSPVPDPSDLELFLTMHVPDYEEKVQAGMKTFAEEFLNAVKKES